MNESFARAVFGNADPVGHTITTLDLPKEKSKLIVGVAKDSKYFTLGEKQRLALYEPYFSGVFCFHCNQLAPVGPGCR